MTSCALLLRKCAIFHFAVNNMFSITKVTNISNIHKHFAIFFLIINLKQSDRHAPFPRSSWPPLRIGQMLQDENYAVCRTASVVFITAITESKYFNYTCEVLIYNIIEQNATNTNQRMLNQCFFNVALTLLFSFP